MLGAIPHHQAVRRRTARSRNRHNRLTIDTHPTMKPNYTDITFILDRSGSMERIAEETISGFNKFLSDQCRLPGEMALTLVQFNQEIVVTLDAQPIGEARPLDQRGYRPNGCTALLDAIGHSIKRTGARLRKVAERDRPSKVVMVILTDGL